jgi:hypothetical protein
MNKPQVGDLIEVLWLSRLSRLFDAFEEEVERALAHRANPSPGGQQTGPFNGDFAGCNITSLHRLQWWLREFRLVARKR